MNELYRHHYINVITELNLDADCWIPIAEVSWREQDKSCHQRLVGPDDLFKIIEEAQFYAVEMAKAWIDNQSIENSKDGKAAARRAQAMHQV